MKEIKSVLAGVGLIFCALSILGILEIIKVPGHSSSLLSSALMILGIQISLNEKEKYSKPKIFLLIILGVFLIAALITVFVPINSSIIMIFHSLIAILTLISSVLAIAKNERRKKQGNG
jgi:hypothetical protein